MPAVKSLIHTVAMSACLIAAACGDPRSTSELAPGAEVVVYAARDAALVQPVLEAYTAETGVPVRWTTDSGQRLLDRLTAEKHQSTADLLLADGAGHLWQAAAEDILRPTLSKLLETSIPHPLRDPEKQWFPLLASARIITYDRRVVDSERLSGYAGLGDVRWRGKLCLSSASNISNQALVAMLILEHGDRPAELIVRAWIANLAAPVLAGDTEVLQSIENGQCSLGVVSSDEAARYKRTRPSTPLESFWPAAQSGGAYVDVVGAGVSRHANNPVGARKLLEWLGSETGQKLLAGRNLEYPVNPQVRADEFLVEWDTRQISPVRLAEARFYREDAVRLMERAGYVRLD